MQNRSPVDALMTVVVLAAMWLLWSGHWTDQLLLSLGAMSIGATLAISWRMGVVDKEGHPYQLSWRPLVYLPWLLLEIVKANIDVTRRVISLDISPTLVRVKATQQTELGHVIYANSITLTPGTISLRIRDGHILVHAVHRGGADDLEEGGMDARVTWLEGLGGTP